MAKTKTKSTKARSSKKSTKSSGSSPKFREEQRAKAKEQNLQAPNAVPEQRPIASQQVPDHIEGTVRKRLKKSGALQDEPMPQSAYDKAASDAQAKKAEKDSRVPSVIPGTRVVITAGDYEGSYAAVTEVKFASTEDERIHAAGNPESRFAEVESVLVRTRGGRHALVSLKPDEYRLATESELGNRGEA